MGDKIHDATVRISCSSADAHSRAYCRDWVKRKLMMAVTAVVFCIAVGIAGVLFWVWGSCLEAAVTVIAALLTVVYVYENLKK